MGSPTIDRCSARYFKPSTPSPWKEYGDVRGLNAPPRSIRAPDSFRYAPSDSSISRDSTAHGPAITTTPLPPISSPRSPPRTGGIAMTVRSPRNSRLARLYGLPTGMASSTPGSIRNAAGSAFVTSPIRPMTVLLSPRKTCALRPYASIFS